MTTIRCSICGDDTDEPADCPDRHRFEDHGLCCMGDCRVCQRELEAAE